MDETNRYEIYFAVQGQIVKLQRRGELTFKEICFKRKMRIWALGRVNSKGAVHTHTLHLISR